MLIAKGSKAMRNENKEAAGEKDGCYQEAI